VCQERPHTHREIPKLRDPNPRNNHPEQHDGDEHVDRRAGQRHAKLLPGILRHPFQPGHAADGQERDIAGLDAESPGHQGVPQFVQHDAPEDGQHERDAVEDPSKITPLGNDNVDEPGDQQDERPMDEHPDPGHLAQLERPFHAGGSSSCLLLMPEMDR